MILQKTKNTGAMTCDEWIGNYSNLKLIKERIDKKNQFPSSKFVDISY